MRFAVLGRSIAMSQVNGLLARASLGARLPRTASEHWRALEAALRRGAVIVVERPRALSRFSHAALLDDAEAEAAVANSPIADLDGGHTLSLRVIETTGRPVALLELELEAADGSSKTASTNSDGAIVLDDVRPGTWSARMTSLDGVDWDPQWGPEWDTGWDTKGLSGQRVVHVSLDLQGRAFADGEQFRVLADVPNCVVVRRPVLRLVTPDFLRLDSESAILVPAPWTEDRHPLAGVVHALLALLDDPARWLLVVGHASAPGSDARNQALSEHRADAIRALLEADSAAWVEHARKRGSLRDVIVYLVYLAARRGWACSFSAQEVELGSIDTQETKQTRACVSAFQAEYNARFAGDLDADGVCGNKTLAAVFEVLQDELQRWLAKLGTSRDALPLERVVYRGYGATLAPRQGDDAQAQAADRVVDLFVIENLPLASDVELAEVYESEVAWRPVLEVPDEPDEWATGPFAIVSDLSPGEPHDPETYRLSSEDGSLSLDRRLPDDAVVEAGEYVVRFEALPTGHRYTLVVIAHDATRSVIFEDLGYGQLHVVSSPSG